MNQACLEMGSVQSMKRIEHGKYQMLQKQSSIKIILLLCVNFRRGTEAADEIHSEVTLPMVGGSAGRPER